MITPALSLPLLLLGSVSLVGCPSSDDGDDEVGDTGTDSTGTDDTTDGSSETATDTTTDTGTEMPAHCEGAAAWISPTGDDFAAIQGLFSDAAEGDILCLDAGVYAGLGSEIILSVNNVTVRGAGMDDSVLDFAGQAEGGNGIKIVADGVTLQDFQVKNTPGDGIRGDQVDDITFERMKVLWEDANTDNHGAYGLYPVGCNNVSVLESVVIGSRDAGHYVGQSNNVLVRDSIAYENVAGVEIENCNDAWVFGNEAYDNTAGLLVFDLPGLEQADGSNTRFYDNNVHDNNTANFAIGGTVAQVPAGSGVVILAANNIEVDHNMIDNHKSVGVLLIHYAELLFGAHDDPDYDIYNRGVYIHDNAFTLTGADPDPMITGFIGDNMAGPELLWDGVKPDCAPDFVPGEEVCMQNNTSDDTVDYMNLDFCGGFANQSTDISEVDCVGVMLPDWGG
ncbi:parallel beta-helix domain-containing protein [Nannocystaceae bacterium ST9]